MEPIPSLMAEYNIGTYPIGSFIGGSNIDLKILTCKDDIVIPLLLQTCIFNWYHK